MLDTADERAVSDLADRCLRPAKRTGCTPCRSFCSGTQERAANPSC